MGETSLFRADCATGFMLQNGVSMEYSELEYHASRARPDPHHHLVRHPRTARVAALEHLRAGPAHAPEPAVHLAASGERYLRRGQGVGGTRDGRGRERVRREAP